MNNEGSEGGVTSLSSTELNKLRIHLITAGPTCRHDTATFIRRQQIVVLNL
jgi:hypothetical protein